MSIVALLSVAHPSKVTDSTPSICSFRVTAFALILSQRGEGLLGASFSAISTVMVGPSRSISTEKTSTFFRDGAVSKVLFTASGLSAKSNQVILTFYVFPLVLCTCDG